VGTFTHTLTGEIAIMGIVMFVIDDQCTVVVCVNCFSYSSTNCCILGLVSPQSPSLAFCLSYYLLGLSPWKSDLLNIVKGVCHFSDAQTVGRVM